MVLSIIAIIIAVASLALNLKSSSKTDKKIKELDEQIRAVTSAYCGLKNDMKEISVDGLEGVSYDPKTTSLTIDGDLVVKGGIVCEGVSMTE